VLSQALAFGVIAPQVLGPAPLGLTVKVLTMHVANWGLTAGWISHSCSQPVCLCL
jgi:hypothetical protein